jgi:hypothetical protein
MDSGKSYSGPNSPLTNIYIAGVNKPDKMAGKRNFMRSNIMRRTDWRPAFLLFAMGAVVAAGQAYAKPNFSGEWKMNASKSEFGPMPAPSSRTDKIAHADPDLKVTSTAATPQGDMTLDLKYTTDGKESTNEIRGNPMKSAASWDGDALVIKTKASFQGNDVTLADRWTLSEDGKTLTVSRHITAPQGEFDQKTVFEKQ